MSYTSGASIGAGLLLSFAVGYGATTGFSNVAELFDTNAPPESVNDVDVSHYQSPNTFKEMIPGWSEGGEVDLKFNYVASNQATINGLIKVKNTFRITLPDSHTWTWNGYGKERGGDLPLDNKMQTTMKVKVAGQPVFA